MYAVAVWTKLFSKGVVIIFVKSRAMDPIGLNNIKIGVRGYLLTHENKSCDT